MLEVTESYRKKLTTGKQKAPAAFAPVSGSTDPATLPQDVRQKIIMARDALTHRDGLDAIREAYHSLYAIADPKFESFDPWARIEGR